MKKNENNTALFDAIRKLEEVKKANFSPTIIICQDCEADTEIACKRDANAVCLECGAVLCAKHMVKHFMAHCMSMERKVVKVMVDIVTNRGMYKLYFRVLG